MRGGAVHSLRADAPRALSDGGFDCGAFAAAGVFRPGGDGATRASAAQLLVPHLLTLPHE